MAAVPYASAEKADKEKPINFSAEQPAESKATPETESTDTTAVDAEAEAPQEPDES